MKPCITKDGYCQVGLCNNKSQKFLLIHRLVAQELIVNPTDKNFIDHINHNRIDNTILNLHWVCKTENSMNRTKRENTSSRYKGVSFSKHANKWCARIVLNGKGKHLGYFTNEKQAAETYNEFALEHFGEHSCLNEISSDESDAEEEAEDETDDVQIYT